jgi:hypothetical protein
MERSEFVDIGECAGNFQLVSRKAYDEVYTDLKKMLEEQGTEAVVNYKNKCWRGELDVPPRRETLIKTIVQERDGKMHLLTADEADFTQHHKTV